MTDPIRHRFGGAVVELATWASERRLKAMATVYSATGSESAAWREVFGPSAAELMFYDFDFPENENCRWESVSVFDADGAQIDSVGSRDPRWGELDLSDLIDSRGETVKFGIRLT